MQRASRERQCNTQNYIPGALDRVIPQDAYGADTNDKLVGFFARPCPVAQCRQKRWDMRPAQPRPSRLPNNHTWFLHFSTECYWCVGDVQIKQRSKAIKCLVSHKIVHNFDSYAQESKWFFRPSSTAHSFERRVIYQKITRQPRETRKERGTAKLVAYALLTTEPEFIFKLPPVPGFGYQTLVLQKSSGNKTVPYASFTMLRNRGLYVMGTARPYEYSRLRS